MVVFAEMEEGNMKNLATRSGEVALIVIFGMMVTACNQNKSLAKGSEELAPVASALKASKSESTSAQTWSIAADSEAEFVMKGKLETIKGRVKAGQGELQIDIGDLLKTRGTIKLDVSTLSTSTFEEEGKNKKQTVDALTWLEVHERGAAADEIKSNQFASFAIRKIDSAVPADLTTVSGAERGSKVKATGELLLHGRKSTHTVELDIKFSFEGKRPTALRIDSAKPFTVSLKAHDVKPRDNVGKLLAKVTQVLQDKVAESADISLKLKATPAGKTAKAGGNAPSSNAPSSNAPSGNAPTPAAKLPAKTLEAKKGNY